LSDLKKKTGKLKLYNGDLNVEYRLNAGTPELEKEIAALQDDGDTVGVLEKVVEQMSNVLVSWDLMGDDGQPVPITIEALTNIVPSAVLTDISNAISEARSLGEKKGRSRSRR
jgi:hypothetical protein